MEFPIIFGLEPPIGFWVALDFLPTPGFGRSTEYIFDVFLMTRNRQIQELLNIYEPYKKNFQAWLGQSGCQESLVSGR